MTQRDEYWESNAVSISNYIKLAILKRHHKTVLATFQARMNRILYTYLQHLPRHVRDSEKEDLQTIVMIEFFETIKIWDPERHVSVWPLAYQRINGAMRDHIRFVTRSDPTRFYEWVNTAANMYMVIQENNTFESTMDSAYDLQSVLQLLDTRDQEIVVSHALHDQTFKQISKKVQLSESQVSRIYNKSIQKIRDILASKQANKQSNNKGNTL